MLRPLKFLILTPNFGGHLSISITSQSLYDITDFADKQNNLRISHTLQFFASITRGQLKPFFTGEYAYLAI